MIRESSILTAAAMMLAGTTVLFAQTQPPRTGEQPPRAGDRYNDQRDSHKQSKVDLRRASELIGEEIHGSNNEKLGDISDLAVNHSAGKVSFAIISTGGVMGIGDTRTIVPFKALKFGAEGQPARLNVAKNVFDQSPKVDDKSWDRLGDAEFSNSIYKHYNVEADHAPRTGITTDTPPGREGQPMRKTFVKASAINGMNVENARDEDLGEINDFMVNIHNGQIAYAVLGFGGVLGMGEKLFAVPWQALRTDTTEEETLVLNVEKDRLQDAPGFDRNNWPDMSDLNWSQNVHAFYGTDANWVYGFADEDAGDSDRADGWQADSEYNRMFRTGKSQTVTGTIQDTERSRPMTGMGDAVVLNVQTEQGQTAVVHLGPAWFIDHQRADFNDGDRVTITGNMCTVDGKSVLLAREVRGPNYTLTLRNQEGLPSWDVYRQSGARDAYNPNRSGPESPR